jgi:hypothetical protein
MRTDKAVFWSQKFQSFTSQSISIDFRSALILSSKNGENLFFTQRWENTRERKKNHLKGIEK